MLWERPQVGDLANHYQTRILETATTFGNEIRLRSDTREEVSMPQPARFPNPRIAAFGDLQRRIATLNHDVVVNNVIRKGAVDRVAKAQALVLAARQKAKPQRLVLQRKAALDIAKAMKARLQNATKSVTRPSPEALLQSLAGRLSTHDALGRRGDRHDPGRRPLEAGCRARHDIHHRHG